MNTVLLNAGVGTSGSLISMLAIYAIIIGLMWFFLIRPQKKQQKQVEEMQNSIKLEILFFLTQECMVKF